MQFGIRQLKENREYLVDNLNLPFLPKNY